MSKSEFRTSEEIRADLLGKTTKDESGRIYEAPVSAAEQIELRKELAEAEEREASTAGKNVNPVSTLTRNPKDRLPPVPGQSSAKIQLPQNPNIHEHADDEIYEKLTDLQAKILIDAGVDPKEVTKEQSNAATDFSKVVQAMEDPKKAAEGYKSIRDMLSARGGDDLAIQRRMVAEQQEGDPVDFGLSSFFSFIGAMLSLEDQKEREDGLEKVMQEFAFLNNEKLSQDDRITNVIKAEESICGKSTTTARTTDLKEESKGDQSSKPQEAKGLSEASKQKVQEKIQEDRKKFLDKAAKDESISKKAVLINVSKAAACVALSVAIPGFGLVASVLLLYLTRDAGKNDNSKLKKKDEEIAALQTMAAGSGKRADFKRPSQQPPRTATEHEEVKKPNHITRAADQVADNAKKDLQKTAAELASVQNTFERVRDNEKTAVKGAEPSKEEAVTEFKLGQTASIITDGTVEENLYDVGLEKMTASEAVNTFHSSDNNVTTPVHHETESQQVGDSNTVTATEVSRDSANNDNASSPAQSSVGSSDVKIEGGAVMNEAQTASPVIPQEESDNTKEKPEIMPVASSLKWEKSEEGDKWSPKGSGSTESSNEDSSVVHDNTVSQKESSFEDKGSLERGTGTGELDNLFKGTPSMQEIFENLKRSNSVKVSDGNTASSLPNVPSTHEKGSKE